MGGALRRCLGTGAERRGRAHVPRQSTADLPRASGLASPPTASLRAREARQAQAVWGYALPWDQAWYPRKASQFLPPPEGWGVSAGRGLSMMEEQSLVTPTGMGRDFDVQRLKRRITLTRFLRNTVIGVGTALAL